MDRTFKIKIVDKISPNVDISSESMKEQIIDALGEIYIDVVTIEEIPNNQETA